MTTLIAPSPLLERTFVLAKPDAMRAKQWHAILKAIECTGLRRCGFYFINATPKKVAAHLEHLLSRPVIFQRNFDFYVDQELMAAVYEGENAVQIVRDLAGATDPSLALPGTIRASLSTDTIAKATAEGRALFNVVHTADSRENAEREIEIWFPRGVFPKKQQEA